MDCLYEQHKNADRRVLWLKKLYIALINGNEYQNDLNDNDNNSGLRPQDALKAFGAQTDGWKSFGK